MSLSVCLHGLTNMTMHKVGETSWLRMHGRDFMETVEVFMPLELAEILVEAYHDYYTEKPDDLNIYEEAALDRADHLRELSKEAAE